MFKKILATLALAVASLTYAQQPQTDDLPPTQPIFATNAKYVNGVAPGFWPTAGATGLVLNVSAGTSFFSSTLATVGPQTITLNDNTTNYVYLDATSGALSNSASTFISGQFPVAVVTTAGGNITHILDVRTFFNSGVGGAGGSLALQQLIIPPVTGQHVVIFPTTCSINDNNPRTKSVCTVDPAGRAPATGSIFQEADSSSFPPGQGDLFIGGFALPAGINPSDVTAIYAYGISSNSGYAQIFIDRGCGVDSVIPPTNTVWLTQQINTLTGLPGSGIPGISCHIEVSNSGTQAGAAQFNLYSIGLIVYYTGSPVPSTSFIGVEPPLTYINGNLGVDPTFPFFINGIPIANLPSALNLFNQVALINDGTGSGDCTVGGGSNLVLCAPNGTTWVPFGASAAVSSVSNSDGTVTVSPTAGNVILGLALGHANTWTAVQTQPAPIFSTLTGGGTQCLQINNSGQVSSTGSACNTGTVSSVSNSDGTLTVSPTTGAVVASLALGHVNTWTGKQTQPAPVFSDLTGGGTQCLEVNNSGQLIATGSVCSTAAVNSVSNSDGTLIISPTTGAVVASLALSHANTWTATQTFSAIIDSGIGSSTSPICPNGVSGAFTTSGCSTGGSPAWSSIINPSGNLSLTMGSNTSLFTFGATTGASDLFKFTDTTSNTGTGIMVHVTTAAGSTEIPFQADANGVGWKVTPTGALAGVGSSSSHGLIIPEGTPLAGSATNDVVTSNSTTHWLQFNPNNAGAFSFAGVGTALTPGVCLVAGSTGFDITGSSSACNSNISGTTTGQVAIAGSANTITASMPLGGSGSRITTGPTGTTSTDCAMFTGTAGQIADAGYACGSNSRPWSCQPGFGDGTNATAAATYLTTTCKNTTGFTVTLTGIQCFSDNNGSSTLNATDNSANALLTGAVTCTNAFAAGTQSAHTTIGNNGYINFTYVADGVTKQSTWVVIGVY